VGVVSKPALWRPAVVLDTVLALGVVAAGLAEIWVPFASRQGDGSPLWSTVGVAAFGLPLAVRRRRPLLVAVVALVGWPLIWFAHPYVLFYGQLVPMGIATYSVARWGTGQSPYQGAAVRAVTLVAAGIVVPELRGTGEVAFDWGTSILAWGAGWGLRRQSERAAVNLQRAIDTEVRAAGRTMAALVEERTRIARELHDVVAHSVSVMVVQAGAAEQVVEDDPEFTRSALAAIRTTGAASLGEMRRVVAMLRESEDGSLAPQPGVDRLPDLVQQARTPDLDVDLVVVGTARGLPTGLDLAAYRIVQEALTNVRRHARATRVRVLLAYGDGDLRLEIEDDGVGSSTPDAPPGHGLIGMRERATMYGGSLETSSPPGHGFTVRAVLPVSAP
jgi:signal transduction histidine kinase